MIDAQQVGTAIKAYRYKVWQRVVYGLMGIFFALGGLAMMIDAAIPRLAHVRELLILGALLLGLAAYLLALGFRSRILLDDTHIAIRGAFLDRSAERRQMEGVRTIRSRYGSFKQLIVKGGGRPISISSRFKTDDSFRAWVQELPDLDRRDREALLAKIEQQEELGATPEERLGTLARAKQQNIALMVLVVAAAAGFNFAPQAWVRLCATVLVLAPLATAWLCWRWPLLYTAFRKKQDPRAETIHALLIAGFGLLFHMSEFHFLSFAPLMAAIAALALGTIAAYYQPARSGSGNKTVIAVLFLAALYAYGAVTMVDACFDSSSGVLYSATVLGGHVTRGRSTTYYLRLAPWGPVSTARDVSVSSHLYDATTKGDTVCLDLHPGRLKAPWFRVSACSVSP